MNIAYIADAASIHGYKWIDHFARTNKVIIICEKNAKNSGIVKEEGNIKIYPILPEVYPLKKIMKRYSAIRKIKEILAENKIEVIHSMYAVPYAFWAYHSGLKNYLVTTRGSDILVDYNKTYMNPVGFVNRINGFFLKRMVRKSLNNARFITSTSMGQQRVIKTFIKDERKLKLIRTGIDINAFLMKYEQAVRTENATVIFSNRAMSPLYNIHIIVEAFAIVKLAMPKEDLKLVLINFNGNKQYYKFVMKRIAELHVQDNITVLESQSPDALVQLYKNSDIIVMIPKSDGTPVSGIESMLAKKPLIIGDLEYDKDIFNPDTVWKLNTISAQELADKIIELCKASRQQINEKIEKAYKAVVELANLEKELNKVQEVYDIMLKESAL